MLDKIIQENEEIESEIAKLVERGYITSNQAKSLARFKNEFLGFFLHELRSPLNSVVGWVHLLQQGYLDVAESDKAVESIDRNARSLKNLIEDLLDASRNVTGKMEFAKSEIDLRRIVENVIEDFTPEAISKNIVLIGCFESQTSKIFGEEKSLRQIVGNILSNALKFTPAGGYVSIELINLETWVQLEVKDSGVGIKTAQLPFIFDRFWHDKASKSQNEGLKLGLAVARFLTESYGGKIEARSDGENKGTIFTIRLPIFH